MRKLDIPGRRIPRYSPFVIDHNYPGIHAPLGSKFEWLSDYPQQINETVDECAKYDDSDSNVLRIDFPQS